MVSEKRPLEDPIGDDTPEHAPKKIRNDSLAIRSETAAGTLLGLPRIWPKGKTHWESTLTPQHRRLVVKALDEPIAKGIILVQPGSKSNWKWKPGSTELDVVKSLCEEFVVIFDREEEAERQRQQAESSHKEGIVAAKAGAQRLQAAWALKHKKMLAALGADLEWCRREVQQNNGEVDPAGDALKNGEWLVNQPEEVKLQLRSYQLEGLRWLIKSHADGLSVILGDEMGLGKTLQTIAYLAHLKFDQSLDGPHLILCPLSVLDHWKEEFARCCPALRVVIVPTGSRAVINQLCDSYPHGYDVVVTTYGGVHSLGARGFFLEACWRTIVLDEGHCIKNPESGVRTFLRRLVFVQALILTGTPLQNDLVELWSLLNFLYPELFPTRAVFRSAFNLAPRSCKSSKYVADAKSLRQVHDFLKVCMLRRMKNIVEGDVPPKVETTIMCPLSHTQRWCYARLLLAQSSLFAEVQAAAKLDGAKPIRGHAWRNLQFLLMQLRKVCNHPYLLSGVDPRGAKNINESLLLEPDESFVEVSGKLNVLDRLLQRLLASGHRCIIFSQFTSVLDIIEKMLVLRGIDFCRLDGSMAQDQRGRTIKDFNSVETLTNVFLLSTRAGGLGINLQTADTCILFDSDWNPQMDLQAMARVHRIGQTRHVHVYRFVTEGTVEERIVKRAQKKLCLDRIVNHNSSVSTNIHLSVEEWITDVQLESSAVVSSGVSTSLSNQELDAIIDRSRQSSTSVHGIIDGGSNHSGADVVEGRVAVEKNLEEHRQEVVDQMKIRKYRGSWEEREILDRKPGQVRDEKLQKMPARTRGRPRTRRSQHVTAEV